MSLSLLGNSSNLVNQIKPVSWGPDRIDVFSRGFDSFIHHNSSNGSWNSGHGLSTGAMDGIIGGILVVAVLAFVTFMFYLLRRNKKYNQGSMAPERGEAGALLRSVNVEY